MATFPNATTSLSLRGRDQNAESWKEDIGYTKVYVDFIRALENFCTNEEITIASLVETLTTSEQDLFIHLADFISIHAQKSVTLFNGLYSIQQLTSTTFLAAQYQTIGQLDGES